MRFILISIFSSFINVVKTGKIYSFIFCFPINGDILNIFSEREVLTKFFGSFSNFCKLCKILSKLISFFNNLVISSNFKQHAFLISAINIWKL